MVPISLQNSGGKNVFLAGVPWNPSPVGHVPTGVKVPLSLLSAKECKHNYIMINQIIS